MSTYKAYAPKCALPDCINKVGYHKKYIKSDGHVGWKWKAFCEQHRTVDKSARDYFFKSKGGCENRDGRLGKFCLDYNTSSLTIDHWDGDRYNNNQDNLVVLCANCHALKTMMFGDNLNRYNKPRNIFTSLFDCQ